MSPAVLAPIFAAALLGGSAAGLLGTLVVGLRLPFVAVFTAHAALAGAAAAAAAGLPVTGGALVGAVVGAVLLGTALRRWEVDPEIVLGTLFSLMLGLAFLAIAASDGPRTELLGLLWGSLLFVRVADLVAMAVALAALVAFVAAFEPHLRLLVVSPELAAIQGPARAVRIAVLVLAAVVIAVNLGAVGGLLVYALVVNPAAAAVRLAGSFRGAVLLSTLVGGACGVGGFLLALALDIPVGASIVLVSTAAVGLAGIAGRGRR